MRLIVSYCDINYLLLSYPGLNNEVYKCILKLIVVTKTNILFIIIFQGTLLPLLRFNLEVNEYRLTKLLINLNIESYEKIVNIVIPVCCSVPV